MGLKIRPQEEFFFVSAFIVLVISLLLIIYFEGKYVLHGLYMFCFQDYTAPRALNETMQRLTLTLGFPAGVLYIWIIVAQYRSRSRRTRKGTQDIAPRDQDLDRKKHNFEMEHPRLAGSNYIRLLAIYPGQYSDDLFGSLTYTNHWSFTKYTALSYTWASEDGDSSLTHTFHSQLGFVRITKNCDAAIRRLRHPDSIKHVWIDAICIDQNNDKEKEYQVAKMGEIYSKANEVVVYIGEEGLETAKLFGWMNSIPARQLRTVAPWSSDQVRLPHMRWLGLWSLELWGYVRSLSISDLVSRHETPLEPSSEILDAIARCSQRRWFSRMWVLQEVSLPPLYNTRIVCGSWSSSASRALHALSFLSHSSKLRQNSLVSIFVLLRKSHAKPAISHLLDLVIATRSRSCSDPRDRVYGILSIVHSLDHGISLLSTLRADYSLSTAQTYAAFSKYCIKHYGADFFLALLKSAPSSDLTKEGLPSWSVDLTADWLNMRSLNGKDFPAASRKDYQRIDDVTFSKRGKQHVLNINKSRILREHFCRDGQLDRATCCKTDNVEDLEKDEVLVELRSGVAVLLRLVEPGYHVFVRVCPHTLSEDGIRTLVQRWGEVVCEDFAVHSAKEENYKTGPQCFSIL